MLKKLLIINFLAVFCDASRQRRYLVYPDGGPARAQLIIGLGVPVDLKDASVTVGSVIKFQYDLPTNSSEYTSRIYGFADTVSRDMDGDEKEETKQEENDGREISENDLNDDNDTLVDITFNDRRRRALLYSEGNVINDNDIKTELPLDEAIRRQELIDQHTLQDEEPQRMNRWDLYKIIEHMISRTGGKRAGGSLALVGSWFNIVAVRSKNCLEKRYGYSGRPCLLRTICEAAEVPFTYENGLLGEIGHILFTPSSTKDTLSHHTDNEYHAAERLGRSIRDEGNCESLFPECESSILDTFTEIGMDTMHKFGLY